MQIDPATAQLVRRLTALRAGARTSQAELGARCGMTQSAVARLESLEQEPRYSQLAAYAHALGCSLVTDVQAGSGVQGPSQHAGAQVLIGERAGGGPAGLSALELGMHALVAGGTGSGRAGFLGGGMVAGALEAGMDVTVIDASGHVNVSLVEEVAAAAGARCEVHGEGDSALSEGLRNPERTARGLARDLVAACGIEDTYWAALSRRGVEDALELVGLAEQAGYAPASLGAVAQILSAGARIPAATKKARAAIAHAELLPGSQLRSLAQPSYEDVQAWRGVGMALEDLLGRSYESGWEEASPVQRGALERGGVQLVQPGREVRGDARALWATLALHSVVDAARARAHRGEVQARLVVVEGAEHIGDEALGALLGWGRASGLAGVLGVRSPQQLRSATTVIQNVNVLVAMQSVEPADAALLSGWMGHAEEREVRQTILPGGEVRSAVLTRDSVPAVRATELRSLGIGEGMVRVSKPAERVEQVTLRVR